MCRRRIPGSTSGSMPSHLTCHGTPRLTLAIESRKSPCGRMLSEVQSHGQHNTCKGYMVRCIHERVTLKHNWMRNCFQGYCHSFIDDSWGIKPKIASLFLKVIGRSKCMHALCAGLDADSIERPRTESQTTMSAEISKAHIIDVIHPCTHLVALRIRISYFLARGVYVGKWLLRDWVGGQRLWGNHWRYAHLKYKQ